MDQARLLKDPAPIPPIGGGGHDHISFHHPNYSARHSCLLSMPRVDRQRDITAKLGVHHGTALLACRIAAGNVTEVSICMDRKGEEPTQEEEDGILLGSTYYFVLDDYPLGGPAYPIVPSFYDWPFPHGQVPESWQVPQNAPTDPATPRCIVSRHALGLKRAHLVHKDDADWFDKEGMDQYTGNIHGINSDENIREIYGPANVPNPPTFVLHVSSRGVDEVWQMFHNVPVQDIEHTMGELHLARFARSILLSVKRFILRDTPRVVIRAGEDGEERVVEKLSGAELRSLYGGGGGRKTGPLNPRKRRRAGGADGEDGGGYGDQEGDGDVQSSETEAESDLEEEEDFGSSTIKTRLVPGGPPVWLATS